MAEIQWFIDLIVRVFNYFIPESIHGALFTSMCIIIGGTHVFKSFWKGWAPAKYKNLNEFQISSVSFLIGLLACYKVWPANASIEWWLAALPAGPAANHIYKVGLKPLKDFLRWKLFGIKPEDRRRRANDSKNNP